MKQDYHGYVQSIIHLGPESLLEDAEYLKLVRYLDTIYHKTPIGLNDSFATTTKSKQALGSTISISNTTRYKVKCKLSEHILYLSSACQSLLSTSM